MQTQWRVGFAGPTGLDYAGVQALMQARRLAGGKRADRIFSELQVMEQAALAEWSRKREADRARQDAAAPKARRRR